MQLLKNNTIRIIPFVLLISALNFLFFHFPFYKFVFNNVDYKSLNGINIIITLMILMLVVNAFVFFLVFFLSRVVGKFLLVLFFIINCSCRLLCQYIQCNNRRSHDWQCAQYRLWRSHQFFFHKISTIHHLAWRIIPAIYIIKAKIINVTVKKFFYHTSVTLIYALA